MNRGLLGWVLVVLQFALIIALMLMSVQQPVTGSAAQWIGAAALLACLLLFATTLRHNRFGNWQVHPAPLNDAVLVSSGPYRWIRHPMYAAVILGAAAAVLWTWQGLVLILAALLVLVMVVKILLEEHLLAGHHKNWSEYKGRTARLIPRIR
jgi:protein-S-isoprenylcysteine O-methyltransferase Ste14